MKKAIVTSILFGSLIFASNNVKAMEETPISISQNGSTVKLHINSPGDYYKVFENGELKYEGTSPYWEVELKEEFHKYKIGIYENNKIKKVIQQNVDNKNLLTKAKASIEVNKISQKEDEMKNEVNGNILQVTATSEQVVLSWDQLPDSDGSYEIYKDGDLLEKTKDLSYIDTKVEPNKQYHYEVLAKSEVDKEQKKAIDNEVKEKNLKLTKEQKQELYSIRGSINSVVKTPINSEEFLSEKEELIKQPVLEQTAQTLAFPGTPQWRNYIFRYTTFIPYKSIEDPKPFNGTYLSGDNRGFDFWSNSYRTRTDVYAYLSAGPPDIEGFKKIGESKRCSDKDCTNIIQRATASDSGIQIIKDTITSTKLQWRVKHDVGIPFGAEYPNINYYYEATLTSSPTLYINGAHDKAPNHEFYMAVQSSDDVTTLHRASVNSEWDFINLIPGAPQTTFNISM